MRPFAKQLVVVLVASWVVVGYPLYLWWGHDVLVAAAVGCAICTLNATAYAAIALWGMKRNSRTFMIVMFGGMGVRILIMLIFFFLALKLAKLHVFGLTLSMFLFYVVFQILEIRLFIGRPSDEDHANA